MMDDAAQARLKVRAAAQEIISLSRGALTRLDEVEEGNAARTWFLTYFTGAIADAERTLAALDGEQDGDDE